MFVLLFEDKLIARLIEASIWSFLKIIVNCHINVSFLKPPSNQTGAENIIGI